MKKRLEFRDIVNVLIFGKTTIAGKGDYPVNNPDIDHLFFWWTND